MSRAADETDEADDQPRMAKCFAATACLVLVACAVAVGVVGPSTALHHLLVLLPKHPGWGWYLAWGSLMLVSIVCLLPIWVPMSVISGLLFGLGYGTLLNFCAVYGAALVSMALGRTLVREPVRRWLASADYPFVRRVLKILEDADESLKLQILFRFLFIPIFIRNYAPSTLRIPFWKLAVSCVPHSLWVAVLFCTMGLSLKDASDALAKGEEFTLATMRWQNVSLLCVSTVMSAILSIYAVQKYNEYAGPEGDEIKPTPDAGERADPEGGSRK